MNLENRTWIVDEMIKVLGKKVELNINSPQNPIPFIIMLSLCHKAIETFITSQDNPIYILIWTGSELPPFMYMVSDRMQKCLYKNCFVTNKRTFFTNVKEYDVILFNAVDMKKLNLPDERSVHQLYVLVGHEPPNLAPVPSEYNGFFNATWTFQLNSDTTLRYIIIKDKNGKVIGPHSDMQWMDANDMKPISKKVKHKLADKRIAAACFISNCFHAPSGRQYYIENLKTELDKYHHRVDLFGRCGDHDCPKDLEECHSILETDYYFYLAFENSFSEDYVTEKVLTATKHFTVPIVYGGAKYTK